jgi:hypothetical protein
VLGLITGEMGKAGTAECFRTGSSRDLVSPQDAYPYYYYYYY